ncbi:MAG: ATP-binding protein [Evtepia sp.]
MLNKMPIRLRLTMLSVVLLAACCMGLTMILNFSANKMANEIEALILTPAQVIQEGMELSAGDMEPTRATSGSKAARSHFFQQSVFFMVLVVMAGGILTYYSSGRALKPLVQLSRQMKNRTVLNLSEALPILGSHDEIDELTISFNEMSVKLEEAFATQKRFSQSAAHELRTPLTVLKTQIDVFRKKQEHSREEYDKLLSVISVHTNRLAALVKDLLHLTNMDALDCDEPILLKTMLLEVVEELSGIFKEKSISLVIDGKEQALQGNGSLLRRAFYNLLENAMKYNVDGGRVEIQLRRVGTQTLVRISDTGIGIPAQAKELIFEPFYRVDQSRSRQMGGAGLGLPIVKAIVEKHGGTITVAENPLGGTVFELVL